MVEQSRLQLAHLALLERIAAFHASHQRWMQAIGWAERALITDPLREHLHRIVMSCHMSMGDRPCALRQYARCEAALKSELGIEPMVETRALRDSIRGHGPDQASQSRNGKHGAPAQTDEPVETRLGNEVDAALSTLREVAQRLDQALTKGRRSRRARAL